MDSSMLRAFFSDVLFVIALATVFLSTVLPFVTVSSVSFIHFDWPAVVFPQRDFSTFRMTYDPNYYPRSCYFADYWFQEDFLTTHSFLPVSYFLVAAFVVQVTALTVGFGVFWMNRLLRIVPLALCVTTILLLTRILSSLWTNGGYSWDAAIGYWLNYPSALLVLSSIILKRNAKT